MTQVHPSMLERRKDISLRGWGFLAYYVVDPTLERIKERPTPYSHSENFRLQFVLNIDPLTAQKVLSVRRGGPEAQLAAEVVHTLAGLNAVRVGDARLHANAVTDLITS